MSLDASVSVILCTKNRSASLIHTLDALADCTIPKGWEVEIVVVDNASSDNTQQVVQSQNMRNAGLRYLFEQQPGLSNARNAGLAHTWSDIILFTDDDVIVSETWIQQMVNPILEGRYDAVTGRTTLASHLLRDWMEPSHKSWLSSSLEAQVPGKPASLIGAAMGFHRLLLARVPSFDPELGAGALGMSEDTLFGLQLVEAGYRTGFVPEALAVHCFEPDRLLRSQWLRDAVKRGRAEAYLLHHWEHATIRNPLRDLFSYRSRLLLRRILQRPPDLQSEGCPTWEMSYVAQIARALQFRRESLRERLYDRHGLQRRDSLPETIRNAQVPASMAR